MDGELRGAGARAGGDTIVGALGDEFLLAAAWVDRCEALGQPVAAATASTIMEHLVAELGEGPLASEAPAPGASGAPLPTAAQVGCLRELIRDRLRSVLHVEAVPDAVSSVEAAIDRVIEAAVRARVAGLEEETRRDPLTRIGNRRALERDLERELARATRYGRQVTVLVVDLDGLKDTNDTYGHEAGDKALSDLVQAFTGQLRVTDAMYRIGGDEFVVVLPETSDDAVQALVQRTAQVAPPFSLGAATAPRDGATVREIVDAADRQLLARRRHTRAEEEPPAWRAPVDAPAPSRQISLDRVLGVYEGARFSTEVAVSDGHGRGEAKAHGAAVAPAVHRTVAEAIVAAVRQLRPSSDAFYVHTVEISPCAGVEVATVALLPIGTPATAMRFGAAACSLGELDGVARAALSAIGDAAAGSAATPRGA